MSRLVLEGIPLDLKLVQNAGISGQRDSWLCPFSNMGLIAGCQSFVFLVFHSSWCIFALETDWSGFLQGLSTYVRTMLSTQVIKLLQSLAFCYVTCSTNAHILIALGSSKCNWGWWKIGHSYWGHISGIRFFFIEFYMVQADIHFEVQVAFSLSVSNLHSENYASGFWEI